MKYCNECKIKVDTARVTCPLCYASLQTISDDESKPAYPEYIKKKGRSNWFYKSVVFVCILSSLVTTLINIITYNEMSKWWCLYVIPSMVYIYMLVRGAILTHSYVVKRLFVQLVTISIIVWFIDMLSGDIRWAMAYVIPSLAVITNLAIAIISIANRSDYSKGFNSMLLCIVFGIIPFIFQLAGAINIDYLWAPLVSFCVSIAIFLGMFVFAYHATKEELVKRFHL